ncbi:C-type lectin domain-containing protein [Aquimarina megaterium]|uniref:C-type lectin domain-containing protein n=1 Tax=Aquimarina megaterium TaxID=1443666 RepID=UPI000470756A|nr:C-type lectin domain-containing protein [Aquimarina megaterium]
MRKTLLYLFALFFTLLSFAQGTYRDEFGSVSYANNDGTLNWAGNWNEIEPFDFNNDPAGGFMSINGNRLRFRWIWSETISRTANLSGATSATLSFNWETSSLEAGEELAIRASSDGTNFTTLATFGGTQSGFYSVDISAYISATTTIRFDNVGNNWDANNDRVFIDNVQILTAVTVNQPPTIVVSGDQHFCPSPTNSRPVVQSVTITDPDDTTADEISIQISSGYVNGQDLLTLTGSHPNITSSWNATEGRLFLTGPATFAEFEAAILAVVYSANASSPPELKEFSIVIGNALFLPETGHFYEFVPDTGIRWDDARDDAATRTYFGLQGYLATLTSAAEAAFAGSQITGNGWIGANDEAAEGQWTWVTGPEAGTLFWTGNQTGSVVPGEFAFWNNGEPNNAGNEDYAHITAPGIGIPNSWNDLPIAGGTAGGAYESQGYIVEYGGMPGDIPLQISGVTRLRISCSVITNRQRTYRVNN